MIEARSPRKWTAITTMICALGLFLALAPTTALADEGAASEDPVSGSANECKGLIPKGRCCVIFRVFTVGFSKCWQIY